MASSQQIEQTVMDDMKAVLDAAGISNVITAPNDRPQASTYVVVRILTISSALDAGTVPNGERNVAWSVEVASHRDDDKTGSALAALTDDVREAIWQTDILAVMTAASTYNTYVGMQAGVDEPDEDGRYRLNLIEGNWIMRPQK